MSTAAVPRPVLVVQNDVDKPVGAVGPGLLRGGVTLDVRSPEHALPPAGEYAGLIVLPGLADPVDEDAPVQRARAAIEEALEARIPVLGLCLGGQLLVQVLGGRIYECRPELGYGPVFTTSATAGDPLLGAAPREFSVFHAHAFAFEPPAEAVTLLTNDVCVQACRHGDAWAIQCHPEVSREWAVALAAGIRGEYRGVRAETAGFFARNQISPAQLELDAERSDPAIREVAEAIGTGFAQLTSRGGDSGDAVHTAVPTQRQRASSARSAG